MKTTLLFLFVCLSVSLFGQNVYIPDANFKAYLVGNPEINTNGDTEIQVSEASSFDGGIYCQLSNISDMTGIEAFNLLTELECNNNQLTSLDVSQNTALSRLHCSSNPINSLDVSQNTALTYLDCEYNELTSLDVSQNTALTYLDCEGNELTSLDVSQNIALDSFVCHVNQLSSLDVSQNTALIAFSCAFNQLTSLDLSQNTALIGLNCSYNQLTTLNLSQNTTLGYLDCTMNQLTCLNVANGNNTDISSEQFLSYSNNLTCIEVDDAAWSTVNWPLISSQMYFSEDCNNDCSNTSSLTELTTSKNLIEILDMMGRETSFKPNTPLIYVYDDGSTEKVFSVEY